MKRAVESREGERVAAACRPSQLERALRVVERGDARRREDEGDLEELLPQSRDERDAARREEEAGELDLPEAGRR